MNLLSIYRLNRFLTKSIHEITRASNSTVFSLSMKPNMTRCLCSKPMKKNVSEVSEEKLTWTPIYYFPMIIAARALNRVKLYQTAFSVVCAPLSAGLYYYDQIEITSVLVITGAATFTCLTLYIVTAFFSRLIGAIFVDKNFENVRIAHLTFWGHRKNVIVPIDDIIRLTDDSCNASDAFVKLRKSNSEEYFYLSLRFGRFLDKDAFQKIFGSFEVLGLKK